MLAAIVQPLFSFIYSVAACLPVTAAAAVRLPAVTYYCTFLTIGLLHVTLGCKPNQLCHVALPTANQKNATCVKNMEKCHFSL
jgi:hypothetical protein